MRQTPAEAGLALSGERRTLVVEQMFGSRLWEVGSMSGICVDEQLATVWTGPDGVPARFVWQQRSFVVCGHPIPWTHTGPQPDATESSRPAGQTVSGESMWQVQARALDNGELLIFDLAVTDDQHWPVTAVFD